VDKCSLFIILYNIHTNVVLASGIYLFQAPAVAYIEDCTVESPYLGHSHVPLNTRLANDYAARKEYNGGGTARAREQGDL
jgi:hypothetical protein